MISTPAFITYTRQISPEAIGFSEAVKGRIGLYDPDARIILFGSRARGDAEGDSDWDLLVLTDKNAETLQQQLIKDLLYEVEMPNDWAISLIVKNEQDWLNHYSVTPLFDSVQKEGIQL